jgi:hypothetical protein
MGRLASHRGLVNSLRVGVKGCKRKTSSSTASGSAELLLSFGSPRRFDCGSLRPVGKEPDARAEPLHGTRPGSAASRTTG